MSDLRMFAGFTSVKRLFGSNRPLDQHKTVGGGRESKLDAFKWMWKNNNIVYLRERLERTKSVVQIALQRDHFKLSQVIRDHIVSMNDTEHAIADRVNAINNSQSAVKAHVETIQTGLDDEKRERLLNWISKSDYPAQHSDIITQRPEFSDCVEGSKREILCQRIPRAGKTITAAVVVDHLHNEFKHHENKVAVTYLYSAPDLHRKHDLNGTRFALKEIVIILCAVLGKFSKIFVVVDALYECADYQDLLDVLRDIQTKVNLRIMATSRNIQYILENFDQDCILELEASDDDNRIVTAVDGMSVTQSKLSKRLKLTVLRQGQDLAQVYNSAIERIDLQPPERRDLATNAIYWITYALRPLRSEELCHALAIRLDTNELDEDNISDIEDIISGLCWTCGRGSKEQDYDEYFKELKGIYNQHKFLSYSITHWLIRPFPSGSLLNASAFFGLSQVVNKHENENVLNLLLDLDETDVNQIDRYGNSPIHLAIESRRASACHLLMGHRNIDIFPPSGACGRTAVVLAVEKWNPKDEYPLIKVLVEREDRNISALGEIAYTVLYVAIRTGCKKSVQLLIGNVNLDINGEIGWGEVALTLAAVLQRYVEAVRILLERDDVDPNLQKGEDGYTPLHFAVAWSDDEDTDWMLFDREAIPPDLVEEDPVTLFKSIFVRHYEPIVKLLVERYDVDINAKDRRGRTLLHLATAWSDRDVWKSYHVGFMEFYENPFNKCDLIGWEEDTEELLHAAGARCYKRVVEILIARSDIDVNARDGRDQTPLHFASTMGYQNIIEVLISATVSSWKLRTKMAIPRCLWWRGRVIKVLRSS
ncbi:ankyrin [Patellaria atrata CBS 101060]|uniref:Ankyrin n=1 Tax=Patellaria atrata CBS 101060 TaxID=1346257 RepID=A0A9P4VM46_9PEZI|nr:ankyrin [Patellaria atrata CBS 101060]